MVPASEIEPGRKMTLVTRLTGQEMQRASTDMLIHSIPRQIAYISTFTPLEPDDVIVTGTPGGVGAKRTSPVFMKAGDLVEVIEVDAIGTLRNSVGAERVGGLGPQHSVTSPSRYPRIRRITWSPSTSKQRPWLSKMRRGRHA